MRCLLGQRTWVDFDAAMFQAFFHFSKAQVFFPRPGRGKNTWAEEKWKKLGTLPRQNQLTFTDPINNALKCLRLLKKASDFFMRHCKKQQRSVEMVICNFNCSCYWHYWKLITIILPVRKAGSTVVIWCSKNKFENRPVFGE